MNTRFTARTQPRRNELDLTIRFGFGLNTRASSDEIDAREAAGGLNFTLDARNSQLRPRKPFDLVWSAPNEAAINGMGQLVQADGTISTLVQAGDTVYETDFSSETSVGSVSSSARLRGPHWHNFTLDDTLLITDLALQEPVKSWDGSTFQTMTENLTGAFKAKFCHVSNERAFFGHVESNSTLTPHVLVGSERGDFTNLSVSDRPSSALSAADPFFLPMPDLRAINGIAEAFGVLAISTREGQMFRLVGQSAEDFEMVPLHPGSGASGDESVIFAGNDIFYGRQGRIESLANTDRFGDVETDDLSVAISDLIQDYGDWKLAYNPRLQRVYCAAAGENNMLVLHKPLLASDLSPWALWETQHSSNFAARALMTMYDPDDGLLYTYFGDASGNVYRLDGTGAGDAGTANIRTRWQTRLFSAPLDAEAYDCSGYIKYRSVDSATVFIRFLFQGRTFFTEEVQVDLQPADGSYFGGDVYFGGDFYFGSKFGGRLSRRIFSVPGQGEDLQVEIEVDGTGTFEINEIGIRLAAAS